MDFAALPPEINSGRMYTGPGSGPMLAAAAAWYAQAAELYSAATSYNSVVSELTSGPWLGPASASMAAAAATNVAWMTTTAAQAEQTAVQAKAAAAAFESAFAMHVPPPVIAANRSLQALLVATNFFGQNTPAIAATEAQYGQMWVQDAAAMYGYADASAAATTVTPFTQPGSATNAGALASQTATVAQAGGTSAGGAQSTLSQLTSAVPAALQGLASPAASTSSSTSGLSGILSELSEASSILMTLEGPPIATVLGAGDGLIPPAASLAFVASILANAAVPPAASGPALASEVRPLGSAVGAAAGSGPGALGVPGLGSSGVTASWGRATLVGALSAPRAWTPTIDPAAGALPGAGLGAAPAVDGAAPGSVLSGLPRTSASVRGKRGAIAGDWIRRLRVLPHRGYTG